MFKVLLGTLMVFLHWGMFAMVLSPFIPALAQFSTM